MQGACSLEFVLDLMTVSLSIETAAILREMGFGAKSGGASRISLQGTWIWFGLRVYMPRARHPCNFKNWPLYVFVCQRAGYDLHRL